MHNYVSKQKTTGKKTSVYFCRWTVNQIFNRLPGSKQGNWRRCVRKNHIQKSINILVFILQSFLFSLSAFERGHCYEPYLQNGNFTTSDPLYGVGTVVQFTCDPGHSLEQGPPVIECISARDPYWNDTEPLCKGKNEGRK